MSGVTCCLGFSGQYPYPSLSLPKLTHQMWDANNIMCAANPPNAPHFTAKIMSTKHMNMILHVRNTNSSYVVASCSHKMASTTFRVQPRHGSPVEKLESQNAFLAPEINSFGRAFRDYNAHSERQKSVEEFYREQHTKQTYDFVKKMREEYEKLDKAEMSIWECCELLNEVVDESDPDLDEPQIQHLLQSAEAIRKDYPHKDWLHLAALIHDLGKILTLPQFGELPQWAVVGDAFPVGCAFDESNVHYKYFKENSDYNNPAYSTKNGIYEENCGLDNVYMSWGHDDYMYMVAKANGTTLPEVALFIIRYHSFYAMHTAGAYKHLMNEKDAENLKWLEIFNKYDLYSKSKVQIDVEEIKPYYLSVIKKYFPAKLRW